MSRANLKSIVEIVPYDGNLDNNVVLDWISEMEKFFDYENTSDNRKVKIAVTRLKGHASLWWENLQTDRQRRGKEKIKTWVKMVNKVKNNFLLADYQVSLLRKMENLRQRDMTVKEYTEEFYRLDISSGHVDDDVEKIARYINGLRSRIRDEISVVKLESVEEAYQYALKVEEILTKKHKQRQTGRGGRFQRGRDRSYGEGGRFDNFVQDKGKFEWKNDDKDKIEWKEGHSYRGGTSSYRGRGNFYSRGGFHGNCFRCGKERHRSFECRSSESGQGSRNVVIQGGTEGSPSGLEAG